MQPSPSKALGDHPRKRPWDKNGPFLSFATKCKCRATYDLNVEAISFAIGQGCRTMVQPEFSQGGGAKFLNNTAQVQCQNPQVLVTIGMSRFFSPRNERCVRFLNRT